MGYLIFHFAILQSSLYKCYKPNVAYIAFKFDIQMLNQKER